jgi:hypothetical protein
MNVPSRYSFSNVVKAIRDPSLILVEARRLALSTNAVFSRIQGLNDACYVHDEDWDNLIILDGCRYDLFDNVNTLEGKLESRTSLGSESWEYLRENFKGREMHDTIYVTANPHAPKLPTGTFHRTVNLLNQRWDEELKTVRPEVMTNEAIKIHEKFPNKRLIVHYMQPHFPFIGDKGRTILHAGVTGKNEKSDQNVPHIWNGLRDGTVEIDEEFVFEAYKENLELTLPHVDRLLSSVNGKSVVTSDHGNLIGDQTGPIPIKGYGHPRGFHIPELVKVPWFVVDAAERRSVVSEPPSNHSEMNADIVESRLKDLGYHES